MDGHRDNNDESFAWKGESVYWFLKGIEGIEELYHVFGEYDLFVIMQVEGINKLNELINDIKEVQNVIISRTISVGWDSGVLQEHEALMRRVVIAIQEAVKALRGMFTEKILPITFVLTVENIG